MTKFAPLDGDGPRISKASFGALGLLARGGRVRVGSFLPGLIAHFRARGFVVDHVDAQGAALVSISPEGAAFHARYARPGRAAGEGEGA